MRIFVICPVRNLTESEKTSLKNYVAGLENAGHVVHWPPRDTDQDDRIGLRICRDNLQAIEKADEIHVWWNSSSQGSLFDFGMIFAMRKKIFLINKNMIERTSMKSFNNVLLELDKKGGEEVENSKIDRLAEATAGRLHWNDPGMDDLEEGWEDFTLGVRVEVRTEDNVWRKGTVVETWRENDRGIVVKCDEKWHDDMEFYEGHGATVGVFMNTRRGILSNIRRIDEPCRKIVTHYRGPDEA